MFWRKLHYLSLIFSSAWIKSFPNHMIFWRLWYQWWYEDHFSTVKNSMENRWMRPLTWSRGCALQERSQFLLKRLWVSKLLVSSKTSTIRGWDDIEGWCKASIGTLPMVKAPIPFTRKMSWLSIVIFSITDFLFSPVVLFRVDRIAKLSDGPLEFFMLLVGCIGHSWLKTICGFVALAQHLTSRKPEWKSSMRSDV